MDQAVEYSDSSESKIIIEQQLNANSDHIVVMDESLTVTKTHSCHVAAIDSLNLHKSGSNRGSYEHCNSLITVVKQKFDKESSPEVCAVDKSLTIASSADSSDSGISPSSISDGIKFNEIVDQSSTTKRSDSDSHDGSNGLISETSYFDAVSELDSISSSTSYGKSSHVENQSSTPKRSGANSSLHGKSIEMVNQEDDSSESDQNVAVVDVENETLSPAHSETDIILSSLKYLFVDVEEPLTAGSDDDAYDSNSDDDEWITENDSSEDSSSDDDDESDESDEPVEIFGGFYFNDSFFNEHSDDYLNDTSHTYDYLNNFSYSYQSMSGYEDVNQDDIENFELNDSIRADILQNKIESYTCRYIYTSHSSGTTDEKCPICLAPFVDQEDVRSLPCNHRFHTKCVDQWFKIKSLECPSCKFDLESARDYEF